MNLNYKPKYPVQTLEKALNVLLFLKNSNSRFGLSIAEISEGTGMPKSGVHRILDTFLEYEFVEKNPSTQTYGLSWGLYTAGKDVPLLHSVHNVDYVSTLQDICDNLQETVNVGILNRNEVVILCKVEPHRRLRSTVEVGDREPVYATALGKMFLSRWSDQEICQLFDKYPLRPITSKTITNIDEFIKNIHQIRLQGYAVDNEEFCDGMTCFAMPVMDYNNNMAAALSVSCVSSRLDEDHKNKVIEEMRNGSMVISRMLGHKW